MNMKMSDEECCPQFDPKKWEGNTFDFSKRNFIRETIPTLFHIPFPPMISKKITHMMDLATKDKKVESKKDETLVLFQDPNAFKSNIYLSVTGNVKGANNEPIYGKYMAKVYEGPFEAVPKFVKEMNSELIKLGMNKPKDSEYFVHFAYCPKCMKKYGHPYMVLFAHISKSL